MALCPSYELFQVIQGAFSKLLGRGGGREPHREEILQPGIGGLHRGDPVDEPAESGPRVRIVECVPGSGSVVRHLPFEAGRYEVRPGREPSVKSGDSDTSSASDFLEGGVQSPFGKHFLGCGKDAFPIALGVGP